MKVSYEVQVMPVRSSVVLSSVSPSLASGNVVPDDVNQYRYDLPLND